MQHTNIYTCTLYRDIHTFLHTCMSSYIKQAPLIIPSITDNGKMIFIHSGYFYSASLRPLLLRNAPDHSNEGARWSSGINAANGARGPRSSRPVYYPLCSDLGQVVNLSLSVA